MTLRIDPAKPPKRAHTYYACVKCGTINDDYTAFAAGSLDHPKYYCLGACIPLRSRFRLWRQERAYLRVCRRSSARLAATKAGGDQP
jgi:hypothetical protein